MPDIIIHSLEPEESYCEHGREECAVCDRCKDCGDYPCTCIQCSRCHEWGPSSGDGVCDACWDYCPEHKSSTCDCVLEGAFCFSCEADIYEAVKKGLLECPECAWPIDYSQHEELVSCVYIAPYRRQKTWGDLTLEEQAAKLRIWERLKSHMEACDEGS